MTKTLLTVPKRTLGRMKTLAQRRKTTVSHLFREVATVKAQDLDGVFGFDEDLRRCGVALYP